MFRQPQVWLGAFPRCACPVCILKRWIWLLLVLVSHQFLLPALDQLTNCKVGPTLLSLPLCQLFAAGIVCSSFAPAPWQGFSPLVPFSLPNVLVVSQGVSPCPAEAGEPNRFGQICGTGQVALFEHCSNTVGLGSSIVLNGWLVLTSMSKKPKRHLDDIGGWLETFSVNCLVLTFSPLLEGSLTLTVVNLADPWRVHWPGLVSVRSGLLKACSRNKFDRLVSS